jgi:flavin-dependent dehydrogenase
MGPALPGHIDLHIFSGGYCGMSHVEGETTNVCLLVRQDVFQQAAEGQDIERFSGWMGEQNLPLGQWLAQATPVMPEWLSIGQVPFVPKTLFEGDVLMVGDAAGMIAPLAGDGMAMALHSGKLAAEALTFFLERRLDGEAAKRLYSQRWNGTFARRLQLGRMLQAVMLRPALLTPGLRLLNLLPALGNFLVSQTRDLSLVER